MYICIRCTFSCCPLGLGSWKTPWSLNLNWQILNFWVYEKNGVRFQRTIISIPSINYMKLNLNLKSVVLSYSKSSSKIWWFLLCAVYPLMRWRLGWWWISPCRLSLNLLKVAYPKMSHQSSAWRREVFHPSSFSTCLLVPSLHLPQPNSRPQVAFQRSLLLILTTVGEGTTGVPKMVGQHGQWFYNVVNDSPHTINALWNGTLIKSR